MKNRRMIEKTTILILFFGLSLVGCSQNNKRYMLLHNANILTMENENILEGYSVLVEGREIIDLGPAREMKIKYGRESEIIRFKNKIIMPGLTDLHIHTNYYWYSDEMKVHPINLCLKYGITTIRDGEHFGNSLLDFLKTPELKKINYIPTVVDRSENIENEINEYPYLKLKYQDSLENIDLGTLYVWGHIYQLKNIKEVEHFQEIAHIREITKVGMGRVKDIIQENDIIVQTTMIALQEIMDRYEYGVNSYTAEEKEYLCYNFIDYVQHDFNESHQNYIKTEEEYQRQIRLYEKDKKNLIELYKEGVKILSCSDSGSYIQGGIPGKNLHEEFMILSNMGFTNYQILETNLITAYEISKRMNLKEKFGKLTPGLRADILVLNSNPLENLENLLDINSIMVAGRWEKLKNNEI